MIISILLVAPILFAGIFYFPIKNKHFLAITTSFVIAFISYINYHYSSIAINELNLCSSSMFLTFKSDKLSSILILLTAFLLFITSIASYKIIEENIARYYSNLFLLTAITFGFFLAADIITFYVCFEISLIPMFFLIASFGGEKRILAAFKLLIYTIFGSLFFLAGMIYIILQTGSSQISDIVAYIPTLPLPTQQYLWLAIMIAFLIKIPVIPLHSWLPAAHVQAPMGGSVFLAGIVIKMGGYGVLKIVLPGFYMVNPLYQNYMFIVGLICIIYASLLVLKQTDIKKIIAYSSIAHMGYMVIALFCLSQNGVYASIVQMVSHGLISAGLFIGIGLVYHQTHSREIGHYGDMATIMPKFSTLFFVLSLANIGLPATSGFIGEFLSIIAASQVSYIVAAGMCIGTFLSALYMLKLIKKMIFSEYRSEKKLHDINSYGVVSMLTLCIMIIYFGIFPNSLINNEEVSLVWKELNFNQYQYLPAPIIQNTLDE